MKPFQKVLIGLDTSELDPVLIKFASFMSRSNPTRAFYFVNIIKPLRLPREVREEFPELEKNALKERRTQIQATIDSNLKIQPESTWKAIVKQGDPSKEILKLCDQYDIDLVILGRKSAEEKSGITIQRLARKAPCNLLIVPKGSEKTLESGRPLRKLLVANDFSSHSALAMEHAINIARKTDTKKEIEIYSQHVYTVHSGYHSTGKTYEEFAEIMRKNAEKTYQSFIKKIDTSGVKVIPVYTLEPHEHFAPAICKLAREIEVDGIVFGARGVSSAGALFIGSFAEKMLKMDSRIPFLVVRNKGDNLGILDYIRKF